MGDPLNYLLELGFTLDEVETLKSRNDFTCQQMADAAKAIVDRGGNPLEAFGPRATGWEKPIPFDEIQTPDFPVEALPGRWGPLWSVWPRVHRPRRKWAARYRSACWQRHFREDMRLRLPETGGNRFASIPPQLRPLVSEKAP